MWHSAWKAKMLESHRAEKKPEGILLAAEQHVSEQNGQTLHDASGARDEFSAAVFKQLLKTKLE